MRLRSYIGAVLVLLGLVSLGSCLNGADSDPVNLPVPFSGALTSDARVAVADGFPLHQSDFMGHPSGDQWRVFDSDGNPVGVVHYTLNFNGGIPQADQNNAFGMTISVEFDDGSSATSDNVQFFDFPIDIPPTFDVSIAAPDEPGARVIATKGVASGIITAGTGIFANAAGETMDLRYVYESVEHEDGTVTLFRVDFGTWIIHGAETPAPAPGIGSGEGILAVVLENGDLPPPAADGSLHFPLFCEGGAPCGIVDYTDVAISRFDAEGIAMTATAKVCKGGSCLTARRAKFEAAALPAAEGANVSYAFHMVEHDPVTCADASGDFLAAACSGKLNLDYRSLMMGDPSRKILLKALASSYVVSRIP
ncbi:MAG TPA: hypothetical protein VFX30_14060 [bacterium]|nr:hypothetical protein [bacterium]